MKKIDKKTIAIGLIVLITVVSAIVALSPKKKTAEIPATTYNVQIRDTDYFFGTSTPKVTIIEFGDFACPYCQASYEGLRKMGIKYGKSVKIIYKDYPLHNDSLDLAMAARCAGEQNLFWAMHDKLFALQGQFATTSLPDVAQTIGVNLMKFNTCYKSKKFLNNIRADYSDGQTLNISGTPTFFINGYRLTGSIPENKLEEIILNFLK